MAWMTPVDSSPFPVLLHYPYFMPTPSLCFVLFFNLRSSIEAASVQKGLQASSSGLLNKIQKYVPKSVCAVDGRSCCLRVRFIIASCCRRTHVRQQWKWWRRVQLLISISGVQAHNYFHGKLPGTPPKIRPLLNFCENCTWGELFL